MATLATATTAGMLQHTITCTEKAVPRVVRLTKKLDRYRSDSKQCTTYMRLLGLGRVFVGDGSPVHYLVLLQYFLAF